MIQKTIIKSIVDTLKTVKAIKEIYPYPIDGTPKKYPAIIFVKDNSNNSFETTGDNFKVLNFKMWLVIDLAGTDEDTVFTDVLPSAVDAVTEAFDKAWNGGTIDGHRVWSLLSSGRQGFTEDEKGKRAWEEMTLTIKLSTSV